MYSSAGTTEDIVVPLTVDDLVSLGSSVNALDIVSLVDDGDGVVGLSFFLFRVDPAEKDACLSFPPLVVVVLIVDGGLVVLVANIVVVVNARAEVEAL